MGNVLAGLGLSVALVTGVMLMFIGLSADVGRDGGRAMGAAMASLPFLAGLVLAYAVATLRGGFDWLGLSRPASLLLVLVAVVAAVVVNFFSAALKLDPAQHVPWAMWPLRGWLHLFWPPLLLLVAASALWPGNLGWPAPLGRGLAATAGVVSLLVCALMLVQWMGIARQRAVDEVAQHVQQSQERDAWIREQVLAADPVKDLVSLMNQTSQYERPDIRALALEKVHAHPDLTRALADMLRSRLCDYAFTFLASNDPPDAAALAEPVRDGIMALAEDFRDTMRNTHTLHSDEFRFKTDRVLAVAERFSAHGVDYRPALRELRAALDESRAHWHTGTPDLPARRTLDAWLASHRGTNETGSRRG